ncbi:hypothetical protein HF313_12770 [Massilia atriviolacea]|uniref:Uncharacterized protein n=1 Tax=Massilia atriviolacea TaxID=2495579 RepID=A0A430HQ35_9BURK|nr:hypothetical protein [Massilia atriviolacea]RSZ59619.1 hypothetical protein EJB06_05320 [Massilia atriviolacea]
MPDYSSKSELQAAITRALGRRSGSEALKAVAYWKETGTFWALKQDGFLSEQEMASLREELGTTQVYHAWLNTCSIDWTASTGLRARMVGVSAHLNKMAQPADWRGLTAAANCDCSVECTFDVERVPAEEPVGDARAVQAAWWTFMSDIPFEHFDLPVQTANPLAGLTQGRATYSA